MPDKLTDKEIVKALEDLKKCNNNEIDCGNCALSKFYPRCPEEIGELALDLFNRLQDENEKKDKRLKEVLKGIENIKEQAYKEFAERLKENSIATFSFKGVVMVEEIDDLVKEMTGEDNESKN